MHRLLFLTTESFPFRSDLSDNKRDKIKQEKFRIKASSQLTRAYFNCVEDLRVNLALALWSAYDVLRAKGVETSSQASESSSIGTSLPVDYTSNQIIREGSSRLLFPFVSNQLSFDTGISIANTSAEPFGSSPTKGEVVLHYFGNTTGGGPAPNPQRSFPIPPGQSLVFTLSSGGSYRIEATPGFQGYIIADCEFPDAEGFAALSQFCQTLNAQIPLTIVPSELKIPIIPWGTYLAKKL